jgi:fructose-1,6-bisphosphatase/sedoheptulose 1,7-bisphosphatase-like protein
MARVVALVPDLMLASRVEATLAGAGHEVTVDSGRPPEAIADAELIVADVGELDPALVVKRGTPVLGFYRHTDVQKRRRAEAAGVDVVVPRSRLARELPELVEQLLVS